VLFRQSEVLFQAIGKGFVMESPESVKLLNLILQGHPAKLQVWLQILILTYILVIVKKKAMSASLSLVWLRH